MIKNNYPIHDYYKNISAYVFPQDTEEWLPCPKCGLKPKVWEYDNGRSTACGCWNSEYDHFSIRAKDIKTVMNESENGQSMEKYDSQELKKEWNKYARETIIISTTDCTRKEK